MISMILQGLLSDSYSSDDNRLGWSTHFGAGDIGFLLAGGVFDLKS